MLTIAGGEGLMTIALPKHDVQVSLLARTEEARASPRPSPCAGAAPGVTLITEAERWLATSAGLGEAV